MIVPTKKRLTIIFTSIILLFTIVIVALSYVFIHQSIINVAKDHMTEDIRTEFLDQYRRSGLDIVSRTWEEHLYQILNSAGAVVIETKNSTSFYPDLNRRMLRKAYGGEQGFERRDIDNKPYLISYFPIDGKYVGRAAMSLKEMQQYEKNFLNMVMVALPAMFIFSYLLSRFLVNHAMARISEFFIFQETFSSNVTHELRSPLASLKGNLEVTLRKERTTAEYKETLGLGLKEVDRIISLLNNLYLLASSKFKLLDLFKKKTDIVRIIDEVARSYEQRMASRGISFTLTKDSQAICNCDEALIRRTIENLIDNAVKYTPEKGTINLNMVRDPKLVSITITNSCKRIEKEEIKHIFDPFYRGKTTKQENIEGKGLGLYISRYIIRSHGGDIRVINTSGTLFSLTVTIPLN